MGMDSRPDRTEKPNRDTASLSGRARRPWHAPQFVVADEATNIVGLTTLDNAYNENS